MVTYLLVILFVFSLLIYLIIDYTGPKKILLEKDIVFNMKCMRAKDLMVQEYDNEGNLWASRGLILYRLAREDDKFVRMTRVPSGFSLFWLNSFSLFRKFTLRPECVEMTIADSGAICAFSSGKMWIASVYTGKFHKTFTLPNYGFKVGRGIMSTGLARYNNGEFLIGEYFSNPDRTSVNIYRKVPGRMQWETVYEFKKGQIRHIHAIQSDPYTGKLWICTGDEDDEAMIGWSDDRFKSINVIGSGSQVWRACQLVFTEKAVFWGTDTGSEELAGIYSWDKNTGNLSRLYKSTGAIFFATVLDDGTIVMSTDREGFPNEKDDKTRLLIIDKKGKVSTVICGTWNYKRHGFRFNFAKLRFQRNQNYDRLAVSVLNQEELPDGDMIIIDKGELKAHT